MTGALAKKTSHLSRATIIIALFTLLSRFAGLLRDRAFASKFGAGDTLDVYYAAFRVPDFLFNLLILGTLSAAFIPVFTEYILKDEERAEALANSIFNLTFLVMALLSGLLVLFAPVLVSLIVPGFDAEKQIQTTMLTRIMLLCPIFFSLSSVFSSMLNSFKRFAVVAALPVIYNFAIIFGIYALYPFFGLSGLAWGVVLGSFLHMILQIPQLYSLGFRWQAVMDLGMPGVRQIAKLFVPRIFGMDLGQISLFISAIIGSTFAAGSIAVYNLASNLQAVPLGIFAISFATVAFPSLSEAAAKGDKKTFRHIFNTNASQILFVMIPLSALMLLLRAQIVRLVLGAGNFDWTDTRRTILTLGFFVFSLFAQGLIPLLARAFYSLQNTLIPVLSGLIAAGINIFSALYLVRFFDSDMKVAALALAFTISSVVNFLILFVWLEVKFGNLIEKAIILKLEKILAAAFFMGAVTYSTLYWVAPYVDTHTYLGLFLQTVAALVLGVFGYLGFGYVLNLAESRHIIRWGRVWMVKIRSAFMKFPEGV